MNRRLATAASVLLFSSGLLGCEDAGKRAMQAHVPALSPQATAQVPVEIPLLPIVNPPHRYYVRQLPPVPDGKEYLIKKVQEKFASGEQNFKAGHLEAARRDFDDAVDWMLESGFDPNSDPKLSELFHRVVDTVYAYELQAFRAGDGFSEAPAVPAAIDEVAEMTFPVDPRLTELAAGLDLLVTSGKRFPAAGAFPRRRTRNMAIRGLPRPGIWASPHVVD